MDPLVSVVIPTVGRDSLYKAVESACRQGVGVEILVVDDSGRQAVEVQPVASVDVQVLRSGGGKGAAYARNVGMAAARGSFIAFLDDDDEWLEGHLQDAVAHLKSNPGVDIYSARALVLDDAGSGRIEPVVLVGNSTIADYFFERSAWRSRCRRIPTPTLVFRAVLRDHQMDAVRSVNEDTWWLLTAERDRGAKLIQSPHIGVIVHGSGARTGQRQREELGDWLDVADELRAGAAATELLWMYGRPAVRSGQPAAVAAIAGDVLRRPRGWTWMPVVAGHAVGATVVGAARVVAARLNDQRRRDVVGTAS